MILPGILSVIQIIFLPGFLIVRGLRLEGDAVRTAILSFALSLIVNHFLVAGLVLCGVYQFPVMLGIFAVEAMVLAWLLRRWRSPTIGDLLAATGANLRELIAAHFPHDRDDKPGILRFLVLAAALAVILGYAVVELANFGGIFTLWDAVISWNRWAIDWAGNRLPTMTWEYPQLLPANWSITYVFIQDTRLWFFAKAVMPFFCLAILLAVFDTYRVTRDLGYLLGVSLTYGLLTAILDANSLGSGYADVPVAMFAFVAVYALILARHAPTDSLAWKYLLLGAVFAAGSALTKQAGLFIAAVYPLLCYPILLHPRAAGVWHPSNRRLAALVAVAVAIVALAAPWYIYKQLAIRSGQDWSAVSLLVVHIHEGRTLLERLAHAGRELTNRIPTPYLVLLAVALAFALRDRLQRWVVLLAAIPFVLIWGLGFSYDLRNLTLVVPLLGTAAAVGIVQACRLVDLAAARRGLPALDWLPNLLKLRMPYAGVLLLVALTIASVCIPSDCLLARQVQLQRKVGVDDINERLYQYATYCGIDRDIVSDYPFLSFLPEFNRWYRPLGAPNEGEFRKTYERPEIGFALIHKTRSPAHVLAYMDESCRAGRSHMVVDGDDYRLFKKVGRP